MIVDIPQAAFDGEAQVAGLVIVQGQGLAICNLGKFHSIMRCSCLKTLAAKYNSSVMKMYKKYRRDVYKRQPMAIR